MNSEAVPSRISLTRHVAVSNQLAFSDERPQESAFADLIYGVARSEGDSVVNQRHILRTIAQNPDPVLMGLFPNGREDIERIKSLFHDTDEKIQPWLGNVSLQYRTIAIFEQADLRAKLRERSGPVAVDYLVSLLREENKGPSDVTELLLKLDISPIDLLRKVTDAEGF